MSDTKKFGTITGVLIPNITMMFGVILFLRLGVITAHAGTIQMLAVIGLSLVIMLTTSFSIGSLATNMQVGSGGVYYIISRTLGIEIGGAIGLVLYFAQLIATTLAISGFSLSLCELFPKLSLTWVECIALTLLTLISGFSASWALRLQGGIVVLLFAAIGSILFGGTDRLQDVQVGAPFYPGGILSFWPAFALFYPAMTGIEARMSLSGLLKKPSRSLYLGNLYSLLFAAFCYIGLIFFANWKIPHAVLLSDPFSFIDFARWPQIVYMGIWGATLSSALGSLLGAPYMLQSMAEDGIVPRFFGKLYGRLKAPRLAIALTYILVAILLFYTTIDQIIPMLAMICLVSYGLLNFVCGLAELMNTPSWRPALRTHWLTSFAALVLIIVAMFMTAPGWAFSTLLFLLVIYFALRFRQLDASFHDIRESVIFFVSRFTLYRLGRPTEHALTWHPQLLGLIVNPLQQEKLVRFAHNLTKRSGILTFATVVPEDWQTSERLQNSRQALRAQFERWGIGCLSEVYPAPSNSEGFIQLIKAYGIGPIQPNTVVLGIDDKNIDMGLVELIDTCRYMQKNILLVRDSRRCSSSFFRSRMSGRKKFLDLWWNPDDTSNFDLTMSLITTLTDGMAFNGANLTIKAQVKDGHAEMPVYEYLYEYQKKNRIQAKVLVFSQDAEISKPGHMSFIGLKPIDENAILEQKHEYLKYLIEQYHASDHRNITVFVTSYDHVDHRAIYSVSL